MKSLDSPIKESAVKPDPEIMSKKQQTESEKRGGR